MIVWVVHKPNSDYYLCGRGRMAAWVHLTRSTPRVFTEIGAAKRAANSLKNKYPRAECEIVEYSLTPTNTPALPY